MLDGRKRVVIGNVRPEIDCGVYPIKRVVGEKVIVEADIFSDGHDAVSARLLYKRDVDDEWSETRLRHIVNDRWRGELTVDETGVYRYTIEGWVDHFRTWKRDLEKKYRAGQDISVDVLVGAEFVERAARRASGLERERLGKFAKVLKEEKEGEKQLAFAFDEVLSDLMDHYAERDFTSRYGKELSITVDRVRALYSTWYERFPRSGPTSPDSHGTFKDCEALIPELAKMGFDVFYLPPIHPIGKTKRKGRNNSSQARPEDVGSPWAIGSEEGGHKSIHPQLGTLEDFERFVKKAGDYGMEIAIDLAFQCSPDHPYIREHPKWFRMRPDGTIQYAENPPKKYEDIYPLNFESDEWRDLWDELNSVVLFWTDKGIRIFRVDNPHTKAFAFWEWLIREIKKDYPEVIFLSEAFTRPKVMYHLAKIGFTQSYTYFTWRNTKKEFIDYLTEITQTEVREYFRPHFWPNTPDILPEHLQYGGRPVFIIRLILAATLSSNYGIYGPAFELFDSQALPNKEEYLNSEKYELRHWDWDRPGNLKDIITRVNRIRKENPALQTTWNLRFYETDNEYLLCYGKTSEDLMNILIIVVNLDPYHTQSGWVQIPVREFGIPTDQPYLVHDRLGEDKYIWQGERNFIELDPHIIPARIFRVRRRLRRERDFDYFI